MPAAASTGVRRTSRPQANQRGRDGRNGVGRFRGRRDGERNGPSASTAFDARDPNATAFPAGARAAPTAATIVRAGRAPVTKAARAAPERRRRSARPVRRRWRSGGGGGSGRVATVRTGDGGRGDGGVATADVATAGVATAGVATADAATAGVATADAATADAATADAAVAATAVAAAAAVTVTTTAKVAAGVTDVGAADRP